MVEPENEKEITIENLGKLDKIIGTLIDHIVPLVLTVVITVPSVIMAYQNRILPDWLVVANGTVIASYFKNK